MSLEGSSSRMTLITKTLALFLSSSTTISCSLAFAKSEISLIGFVGDSRDTGKREITLKTRRICLPSGLQQRHLNQILTMPGGKGCSSDTLTLLLCTLDFLGVELTEIGGSFLSASSRRLLSYGKTQRKIN